MSAPLKTNTPAPLTCKLDWAHAMTDKLKSGSDNEPEIYDTKVGKCKPCQQVKKEAKEKEARECQQREEVEHWAKEEAAAVRRQEEADHWVWEECRTKEEKECLEREAVVHQEAAIKKATEGMALDSAPQPSPMGKSSPPTKHQCNATSPCAILLSEVGKHHHAFPKGSFKARFIPPAIPVMVHKHLSAHPLFWFWTVKAGPNAGKSFCIPTVPTSCGKDSPQAVQWLISAFHAFKAQLTPKAINAKTGQVLPAYVKVYQNNMLLHLAQQQAIAPLVKATPPGCIPPLPPPRPQCPGSGSSSTASWRRLQKSDRNLWHFGSSSKNSRTLTSHPVRPRPTLAAPCTLPLQQCPPIHPPPQPPCLYPQCRRVLPTHPTAGCSLYWITISVQHSSNTSTPPWSPSSLTPSLTTFPSLLLPPTPRDPPGIWASTPMVICASQPRAFLTGWRCSLPCRQAPHSPLPSPHCSNSKGPYPPPPFFLPYSPICHPLGTSCLFGGSSDPSACAYQLCWYLGA